MQQKLIQGFGDELDEMIQNAKLPIYVHFEETKEMQYCPYGDRWLHNHIGEVTNAWNARPEQVTLFKSLAAMKHTVPVTNIVCIGNGSLVVGSDATNQHAVAWALRPS